MIGQLLPFFYIGGLFFAAILLATGLFFSFFTPPRFVATVLAASITIQFYLIPIAGIFISVCFLASWILWPMSRELLKAPSLAKPWIIFGVLLLAVQAVSLIWSPSINLGLRQLAYCAPFFFVIGTFYKLSLDDHQKVEGLIYFFMMTVIINGVLVIIFRFSPAIEAAFINSIASRIVNSPNAITFLGDARSGSTIADPTKAGGLFLNPNVSAVLNGMAGVMGLYWSFKGAKVARVVGVFLLASVFCTGSKAAMALAVLIPLLLWFMNSARNLRLRIDPAYLSALLASVAGAFAVIYTLGNAEHFEKYLGASENTLNSRQLIWAFAWQEFQRLPLQGHGFGGWSNHFYSYAVSVNINPSFPPHNSLIILWTQSGIIAPLVGVCFQLTMLYWAAKNVFTARSETTSQYFLALFGAILWYFIQGYGENFGILGEAHLSIALAMMLGFGLALQKRDNAITQSQPRSQYEFAYNKN